MFAAGRILRNRRESSLNGQAGVGGIFAPRRTKKEKRKFRCYVPFVWQALLATTIGMMVIAGGTIMCIVGYQAGQAAAAERAAMTEGETLSGRGGGGGGVPAGSGDARKISSPSVVAAAAGSGPGIDVNLNDQTISIGGGGVIGNLSYVGPILMSFGCFALVFSCVIVCETRDRVIEILDEREKKGLDKINIQIDFFKLVMEKKYRNRRRSQQELRRYTTEHPDEDDEPVTTGVTLCGGRTRGDEPSLSRSRAASVVGTADVESGGCRRSSTALLTVETDIGSDPYSSPIYEKTISFMVGGAGGAEGGQNVGANQSSEMYGMKCGAGVRRQEGIELGAYPHVAQILTPAQQQAYSNQDPVNSGRVLESLTQLGGNSLCLNGQAFGDSMNAVHEVLDTVRQPSIGPSHPTHSSQFSCSRTEASCVVDCTATDVQNPVPLASTPSYLLSYVSAAPNVLDSIQHPVITMMPADCRNIRFNQGIENESYKDDDQLAACTSHKLDYVNDSFQCCLSRKDQDELLYGDTEQRACSHLLKADCSLSVAKLSSMGHCLITSANKFTDVSSTTATSCQLAQPSLSAPPLVTSSVVILSPPRVAVQQSLPTSITSNWQPKCNDALSCLDNNSIGNSLPASSSPVFDDDVGMTSSMNHETMRSSRAGQVEAFLRSDIDQFGGGCSLVPKTKRLDSDKQRDLMSSSSSWSSLSTSCSSTSFSSSSPSNIKNCHAQLEEDNRSKVVGEALRCPRVFLDSSISTMSISQYNKIPDCSYDEGNSMQPVQNKVSLGEQVLRDSVSLDLDYWHEGRCNQHSSSLIPVGNRHSTRNESKATGHRRHEAPTIASSVTISQLLENSARTSGIDASANCVTTEKGHIFPHYRLSENNNCKFSECLSNRRSPSSTHSPPRPLHNALLSCSSLTPPPPLPPPPTVHCHLLRRNTTTVSSPRYDGSLIPWMHRRHHGDLSWIHKDGGKRQSKWNDVVDVVKDSEATVVNRASSTRSSITDEAADELASLRRSFTSPLLQGTADDSLPARFQISSDIPRDEKLETTTTDDSTRGHHSARTRRENYLKQSKSQRYSSSISALPLNPPQSVPLATSGPVHVRRWSLWRRRRCWFHGRQTRQFLPAYAAGGGIGRGGTIANRLGTAKRYAAFSKNYIMRPSVGSRSVFEGQVKEIDTDVSVSAGAAYRLLPATVVDCGVASIVCKRCGLTCIGCGLACRGCGLVYRHNLRATVSSAKSRTNRKKKELATSDDS